MIVLLCCHRPFLSSGPGNWIGASSDDTPNRAVVRTKGCSAALKKGVAVSPGGVGSGAQTACSSLKNHATHDCPSLLSSAFSLQRLWQLDWCELR